jgi:predicted PurR-regulated permease PerM
MAAHLKSAAKRGSDAKPADVRKPDVRKPLPLHAGARLTARLALAMALVAAALWTASDFLPALIWAAIMALAVWPLYARFAGAVSDERSSLAAFLFTTLVGATLIFPIALAT